MQILVGETSGPAIEAVLRKFSWGRMFIFRPIRVLAGESWGYDNGAYRDWQAQRPFDEVAYARRTELAALAGTPLLAVLPDIVGKGRRSLDFSMRWIDKMPPTWPLYLAVQDGLTVAEVKPLLKDKISGIFLGGTDPFKSSARAWCVAAHAAGIKFHYGRCGTMRKLAHALDVGADSVDSSFPLWTKSRRLQFHDWTVNGVPQGYLWQGDPCTKSANVSR